MENKQTYNIEEINVTINKQEAYNIDDFFGDINNAKKAEKTLDNVNAITQHSIEEGKLDNLYDDFPVKLFRDDLSNSGDVVKKVDINIFNDISIDTNENNEFLIYELINRIKESKRFGNKITFDNKSNNGDSVDCYIRGLEPNDLFEFKLINNNFSWINKNTDTDTFITNGEDFLSFLKYIFRIKYHLNEEQGVLAVHDFFFEKFSDFYQENNINEVENESENKLLKTVNYNYDLLNKININNYHIELIDFINFVGQKINNNMYYLKDIQSFVELDNDKFIFIGTNINGTTSFEFAYALSYLYSHDYSKTDELVTDYFLDVFNNISVKKEKTLLVDNLETKENDENFLYDDSEIINTLKNKPLIDNTFENQQEEVSVEYSSNQNQLNDVNFINDSSSLIHEVLNDNNIKNQFYNNQNLNNEHVSDMPFDDIPPPDNDYFYESRDYDMGYDDRDNYIPEEIYNENKINNIDKENVMIDKKDNKDNNEMNGQLIIEDVKIKSLDKDDVMNDLNVLIKNRYDELYSSDIELLNKYTAESILNYFSNNSSYVKVEKIDTLKPDNTKYKYPRIFIKNKNNLSVSLCANDNNWYLFENKVSGDGVESMIINMFKYINTLNGNEEDLNINKHFENIIKNLKNIEYELIKKDIEDKAHNHIEVLKAKKELNDFEKINLNLQNYNDIIQKDEVDNYHSLSKGQNQLEIEAELKNENVSHETIKKIDETNSNNTVEKKNFLEELLKYNIYSNTEESKFNFKDYLKDYHLNNIEIVKSVNIDIYQLLNKFKSYYNYKNSNLNFDFSVNNKTEYELKTNNFTAFFNKEDLDEKFIIKDINGNVVSNGNGFVKMISDFLQTNNENFNVINFNKYINNIKEFEFFKRLPFTWVLDSFFNNEYTKSGNERYKIFDRTFGFFQAKSGISLEAVHFFQDNRTVYGAINFFKEILALKGDKNINDYRILEIFRNKFLNISEDIHELSNLKSSSIKNVVVKNGGEVVLPEKCDNNNDLIEYLTQKRFIERSLVDELLKKGNLYQGMAFVPSSNDTIVKEVCCVFMSKTSAEIRGIYNNGIKKVTTNTNTNETQFTVEVSKDKRYSVIDKKEKQVVAFCEAAIDAVSFRNIYPKALVASMSGLKKELILKNFEHMLNDYKDVKFVLAPDNYEHDTGSQLFLQSLMPSIYSLVYDRFLNHNLEKIDTFNPKTLSVDDIYNFMDGLYPEELISNLKFDISEAIKNGSLVSEKDIDNNVFKEICGKIIFDEDYVKTGIFELRKPSNGCKDWNEYLESMVKSGMSYEEIVEKHNPNLTVKFPEKKMTPSPKI